VRVEEHTIELAGAPAFFRSARAEDANGAAHPGVLPVYLHGAPTSSADWIRALERTGGLAPDLLGFGHSAKGGHLEYSPESLADFVEDLLSQLSVDRIQLITHGWGTAAGVLLAARDPGRVERVVMFNSIPLLPGLTWPWWARLLRGWGVGELTMGAITKTVLARWLRTGAATPLAWPSPPPEPRPRAWRRPWRRRAGSGPVDRVWNEFDQGTQRAILRLQRSVDEERERAMATALQSLNMPILVVWGNRDPWWDARVLNAYGARLPKARIEQLPEAGHWPWLDEPTVIDRVAEFLEVVPDH
jgi:haloalkane dehalogenase